MASLSNHERRTVRIAPFDKLRANGRLHERRLSKNKDNDGSIMSTIEAVLAQDIVERTMKIIPFNVNVMDSRGIILGSGETSRIGGEPLKFRVQEFGRVVCCVRRGPPADNGWNWRLHEERQRPAKHACNLDQFGDLQVALALLKQNDRGPV